MLYFHLFNTLRKSMQHCHFGLNDTTTAVLYIVLQAQREHKYENVTFHHNGVQRWDAAMAGGHCHGVFLQCTVKEWLKSQ